MTQCHRKTVVDKGEMGYTTPVSANGAFVMQAVESRAADQAAKLRQSMRQKQGKLNALTREAIHNVGPTGLSERIGGLRRNGVQERIGKIGHLNLYITAVIEAASESDAEEVDIRKFVKHFLAKDPVFSNSDVGMAATQFEAWLIDEESEAFRQLLETIAQPGAPDFLAVFQGKLKPDVWEEMQEGTKEFVTLKMLIEAGEQRQTEHERSDVTIISGVPTPANKVAKSDDDDTTSSMPDDPMNPPKDSGYLLGMGRANQLDPPRQPTEGIDEAKPKGEEATPHSDLPALARKPYIVMKYEGIASAALRSFVSR